MNTHETALKVLYVSAELAPFVKTGGLGDVAEALPEALLRQGIDVRIAMPLYRSVPRYLRGEHVALGTAEFGHKRAHGALRRSVNPGTGVPLYLIEHDVYFNRERPYGYPHHEYEDNLERFCFFSMALLDALPHTGWVPDVVHCNDWHTAAIPALLRTRHHNDPAWAKVPSVFTIHNMAYQGRYPGWNMPQTGLGWELFTPDCLEFYGDVNLMKGALAFADAINTVSPRYAKEIQMPEHGHGLDGFLSERADRLSGILNGIDTRQWNPATDVHIEANFSNDNLAGKALCKQALQLARSLPRRDVPLFGIISRLVWQKGLDLVADALDTLLQEDIQVVVLGTGEPQLEGRFLDAAERHPDKMRAMIGFDEALAHQIEAGCDFFLMPSRFEPCGLNQMYSLNYGTIPIVRNTGGLADTVRDLDAKTGTAPPNGIVFDEPTAANIILSVRRAIALYRQPGQLDRVRRTGMGEDLSWERSSQAYVRLYEKVRATP